VSIELKPGRYYVGVWWMAWTGGDWMACIWNDGERECLQYRFRYHVDDKVFDSDDQKSWYEMTREIQPDAVIVQEMNTSVRALGAAIGAVEIEYIYIGGDSEKVFRAIVNAPWAHFRKAGDE